MLHSTLLAVALGLTASHAQAINKCIGSDGRVSFQEFSCAPNEKSEKLGRQDASGGKYVRSIINTEALQRFTEEQLKDLVRTSLKDPESANFKNLRVMSNGRALCGDVNAKNSYGGYTGFKAFVADSEGVYWENDGSTAASIGRIESRRTYVPRAHAWGCL